MDQKLQAGNDRYKWVALSNTTLGIFMAALDSSIVIISLPAIFRGIKLNPLLPSNIGYLLWMLMGYLVCMAVLVVTFGRLGDIFGRVRLYNLGFAVFTVATHDRLVHRSDRGRPARRCQLAPDLLGQRALRAVRNGVGLPQAARNGLTDQGPD